jgi:hypothetical protein
MMLAAEWTYKGETLIFDPMVGWVPHGDGLLHSHEDFDLWWINGGPHPSVRDHPRGTCNFATCPWMQPVERRPIPWGCFNVVHFGSDLSWSTRVFICVVGLLFFCIPSIDTIIGSILWVTSLLMAVTLYSLSRMFWGDDVSD